MNSLFKRRPPKHPDPTTLVVAASAKVVDLPERESHSTEPLKIDAGDLDAIMPIPAYEM